MTRAGLYVRVSTDQQAEKYSLSAQRRLLSEYCDRQEWTQTVYEDAGISGETIAARPAMKRLLVDVAEGKLDVVLAIEMERFSRSQDLEDWLVLKKTFRKAGIRFGTPTQLFNPDDPEDAFLTVLLGALSAREKAKLVQRTQRGKVEAARQGKYQGRIPYGYRLKEPGTLALSESEANAARQIFRWALAGKPTRTIARLLNNQGVTSPMGVAWTYATVYRILTNPAYTGKTFYNRRRRPNRGTATLRPEAEWISLSVPRIVNDEDFEAVQRRLQRQRSVHASKGARLYLLRGLVRCGVCGSTMRGSPQDGRPFYRCAHTWAIPGKSRCHAKSVDAGALEGLVWEQVRQVLDNPEAVLAEARRQRESLFSQRDEHAARLSYVRASLANIPGERQRLQMLFAEGHASLEDTRANQERLDKKRTSLDEERVSLESRLSEGQATKDQEAEMQAAVARARRRLTKLSASEMFGILHAFIQRVVVQSDGKTEIQGFAAMPGGMARVAYTPVSVAPCGSVSGRLWSVLARASAYGTSLPFTRTSTPVGRIVRSASPLFVSW